MIITVMMMIIIMIIVSADEVVHLESLPSSEGLSEQKSDRIDNARSDPL